MPTRHPVLTFCILLTFAAAAAHADVFMRLGRGAQALEQLGGTLLHRSEMRVNGQPGKIAVYGFPSSPEAMAPDLRKALDLPGLVRGAAMVTQEAGGQATTLLLLPGANAQSSMVLLIEQTAEARRKAQGAAAEWPGGLAYPGATPTFSAELAETRTSIAIATTTDAPAAAAGRMDAVLARAGWTRVTPPAAASGLVFYSRGNRICAFSAIPDDAEGKTRITVLQRLGASQ
jgi:hypothetical protein